MRAARRSWVTLVCVTLLLAIMGKGTYDPAVQQVLTASDGAERIVPLTTAQSSASPSASNCRDPMSRPSSASYGSQPNSTSTVRSYTPTINITRNDYETALAKWRAQEVYEYEIEVEHVARMPFEGTLHVTGDQVEVLPIIIDGESYIPIGGIVEDYTVAALFEQVDAILTHGLCTATGEWAFPVAYQIAFDPEKGYPTVVERDANEPPEWQQEGRYSTLPAHSSYWIKVKGLKVLRTGVPGMPSTGHPGN